eukprot:CAMPEP_0116861132 /NCGR_PEP_ID=MMETSP0418-20121206/22853_1 /TAXON_ID=1158023 /ORGANISM="Astrosyne radiata, Strain 13vi08-1A" /LENGTH=74 /DNA_ID=CAMNT_0004495721 /DNA_START=132 /DNA_END=356 /DNA_ORIENTATION=-
MEGAPLLVIPCEQFLWFQNTTKNAEEGDTFAVRKLDPKKYAERVLDISDNMVTDHLPPMYENAFKYAVQHKLES